MSRLTVARARRIALGAQGLSDPRPSGKVDVRHFRRSIGRVGLVQLDSVNVLARAHYLPFFARLGGYSREALDRWAWGSGELFEYWGHAVSLMPLHLRPLFIHRMERAAGWKVVERFERENPGYLAMVMDQVVKKGPLGAGDLDDPGRRSGPWWGYGKGKEALDWFFHKGAVTVARRVNFNVFYDLPERVLPKEILSRPVPDIVDARRELLRLAAGSLGVGTMHDLADYYRVPVSDAGPLLKEMVKAGELEQVEIDGWKGPVYLDPSAKEPRSVNSRALIGPFDSLIWFRPRVERLFGFNYRLEIYVPEPKRVYGYYVLAFLLGDQLVARVDLKADRGSARLLVRGAYSEDGIDKQHVAGELFEELTLMAEWLELGDLQVDKRGDLAEFVIRNT
jgi:uncharacterized protein YcaQ